MTGPDSGPGRDRHGPGSEAGTVAPQPGERRPLVERIGVAAIAAVFVTLFAFVAVASWVSGEPFLAFMAALSVAMTGWLGLRTLFQG